MCDKCVCVGFFYVCGYVTCSPTRTRHDLRCSSELKDTTLVISLYTTLDGTVCGSSVAQTHTLYLARRSSAPAPHFPAIDKRSKMLVAAAPRRAAPGVPPPSARGAPRRTPRTYYTQTSLRAARSVAPHTRRPPSSYPRPSASSAPLSLPYADATRMMRVRERACASPQHPCPHLLHTRRTCVPRAAPPATGRARATEARGAHERAAKRPGVGRAASRR